MLLRVILDIGADGRYVATIESRRDAYSRADTKDEAERLAISLFLEETARKLRRHHWSLDLVFPIQIQRVDLDYLICECTLEGIGEKHYRSDHIVTTDIITNSVVFGFCKIVGCDCGGFKALPTFVDG